MTGDDARPASLERIGVLGLGRMGGAIAARLVGAGFDVAGFDTDAERLSAAVADGVAAAVDGTALAEASTVLISVLPGAAEAASVLGAGDGALAALPPGSLWLDLTSGDPRTTAALAADASTKGVQVAAAPMGGGPAEATSGALRFFLAGEPAALRRAAPLLAPLAAPGGIVELGDDPAAAQTVKLLANLLWFGQAAAVSEALLLGTALGLDVEKLRQALSGTSAGSVFIDRHLPLLLAGDYMADFGLDRVVGELDTVTALAAEHAVPFRMSQLAADLHHEALDAYGPIGGELLVARLLEDRAGRFLRSQL